MSRETAEVRPQLDSPVMPTKLPAVYLLASGRNGAFYAGVTSNLVHRVWQHRTHCVTGFTDRYQVTL